MVLNREHIFETFPCRQPLDTGIGVKRQKEQALLSHYSQYATVHVHTISNQDDQRASQIIQKSSLKRRFRRSRPSPPLGIGTST